MSSEHAGGMNSIDTSRMKRQEDKSYEVVILTDPRWLADDTEDAFTKNVLLEDGLLKSALEKLGLRVGRLSWDDPYFDWTQTQCAVFRTTWDYFERMEAFEHWLNKIEKCTRLINPAELIRWNLDKIYLKELEEEGLKIVPTRILERTNPGSLIEWQHNLGSDNLVLKPRISAGSFHTYRISSASTMSQDEFESHCRARAMMLQPMVPSVLMEGEYSMVMIDGKFSHAVQKKAKKGDFRVQDDFGGTVHPYKAAPEEIEFALSCLGKIEPRPSYARIDWVRDAAGRPMLMEMELLEPELWFRQYPKAAKALARAIAKTF